MKSINILCLILFVFVIFLLIKTYHDFTYKSFKINNTLIPNINKYNFKKFDSINDVETYCQKLLGHELYVLSKDNNKIQKELKEYENINNINNYYELNRDRCIEILEYHNNFTMSWLGSYYYKKSEIILNNFIIKTENQFSDDSNFINLFKEKFEELDKTAQIIVNKEFPNPYEGSGTRLFRYNRFSALNYIQLDILKGFVAKYCLKNFENNCFYKIYDRKGKNY